MPTPTPSTTISTYSPELSAFFQWNFQEMMSQFIGMRILPIFEVGRAGGDFPVIPLEQMARHQQTGERASGAGYARDDIEFGKGSFKTKEYGFEEVIDRRDSFLYSGYLNAHQFAVLRLINKFMTAHERRTQAAVMAAGQYTGRTHSPANKWDSATGVPITDIEIAYRGFRNAFGLEPDTIILSKLAFRDLRNNPEIVTRINSSGAGNITRASDVTTAQLAEVFDIPKILVGGGMRNTANIGAAASMSDIWADNVLVTKTADTDDIRETCIGRTFHWDEDGSQVGGLVENYYSDENRSDVVRIRGESDSNVMYPGLGYLITDVATSH